MLFSLPLLMVYIPGITKTLARRKGGGKGSRKGSSGSSSPKKVKTTYKNLPSTVTTYGNGGGRVSKISSGIFAGRTIGGGTRAQVYGNRFVRVIFDHPISSSSSTAERVPAYRKYGSGYTGYPIGVAGYGFPFFFWPLAWGGGYGAHYIHTNEVSTL